MLLEVAGVDAGILDGVAAVQHHAVADIDAHMTGTAGFIGLFKEDEVSGACFRRGHIDAHFAQILGTFGSDIPVDVAVV